MDCVRIRLRRLRSRSYASAVPFATYFPAVLAATLIGGRTAGAVATLLSAVVSWYAFIPPRFVWTVITRPEAVSLILFVFASSTIIWIADQYRRVLRRLDEEERYRQVVVDELGHRVKNKLATIHAILRHELRGHPQTWDRVSGRLRALSTADDFLLQADGEGIDMRELLALELKALRREPRPHARAAAAPVRPHAERAGADRARARHQRGEVRRAVG
jgi:hypothetical protein